MRIKLAIKCHIDESRNEVRKQEGRGGDWGASVVKNGSFLTTVALLAARVRDGAAQSGKITRLRNIVPELDFAPPSWEEGGVSYALKRFDRQTATSNQQPATSNNNYRQPPPGNYHRRYLSPLASFY